MSGSEFLKSFRKEWGIGVERNPTTLRELLYLGEAALDESSLSSDFMKGCELIRGRVVQVYEQSADELEAAETIAPELLQHLEGSMHCYEEILETLEALRGGLELELLGQLEEDLEQLAACQDALALWENQPSCPRCGYRGGTRECPDCRVHLVLADANPPALPPVKLGPDYVKLREVAGLVAQGQVPYKELEAAIGRLGSELFRMGALARQGGSMGLDLSPFKELLGKALAGLEQMQRFDSSCHIADLNQGWAQVSQAGVALLNLSEQLQEEG